MDNDRKIQKKKTETGRGFLRRERKAKKELRKEKRNEEVMNK
jgi:hypothetical protein